MLVVLIVCLPGSVDLPDRARVASQNRLLVAIDKRVAANLELLLVGRKLVKCLGSEMDFGDMGSEGQTQAQCCEGEIFCFFDGHSFFLICLLLIKLYSFFVQLVMAWGRFFDENALLEKVFSKAPAFYDTIIKKKVRDELGRAKR